MLEQNVPVTLSNLQRKCVPLAFPPPNTGLNLATVPPSSIVPSTVIVME